MKIEHVDITEEEFNRRMNGYKTDLAAQFAESRKLEDEIMAQFGKLEFSFANERKARQ